MLYYCLMKCLMKLSSSFTTQIHEKEMLKKYNERAKNDEINNKLKAEKASRKQW